MSDSNWLKKAVIYHVFIDRFFRGASSEPLKPAPPDTKPEFCGGNLQGVAEKLGYLTKLGVNTLWLSPFNKTAAYHGYHVTDYFGVDERFGGEDGLRALVKAAREHGMRLIMDFVPNHVHDSHPFFQLARRNPKSPYRRWFYWLANGDYLKFLHVNELPKLNLDHPPARDHVIEAACHWMERGIDGFRLDHALGPSIEFWDELRRRVKSRRPDAVLFGEAYFFGIPRTALPTISLPDKNLYFLAGQLGLDILAPVMREYAYCFDGVLDFHFQNLLRQRVAKAKRKVSESSIIEELERHYESFPGGCSLLSFLDNHDMHRFLFDAGGDKGRLKCAAGIQFAMPVPPVIYYGTEIGMSQTGPFRGDHADLKARAMMRWNPRGRDLSLFRTYQELIQKWKTDRERDV